MRFLADESCDFAVVRALRAAGHDVEAVAEVARGASDSKVMALASAGASVLLTEDKDFGQLVYADAGSATGVVLVRFPATARAALGQAITSLVESFGDRLPVSFVVLEPGRVRIATIPGV